MTTSDDQLGFGFEEDRAKEKAEADRQRRVEEHRQFWQSSWGWDGPTPGGFCNVATVIAELETPYTNENGLVSRLYCYTERCRLIEQRQDGRWLAVIEMGETNGKPWEKDGTRLLLDLLDIDPPIHDIIAAREGKAV